MAMPVADLGTMAVLERHRPARRSVCGSRACTGVSGCWARPNTPGWFELHTRDYRAAVVFYRDVFGWDTQAASDTTRVPVHRAGRSRRWVAGRDHGRRQGSGRKEPTGRWSVYFGVDDADAALTRIVELGGSGEASRGGHPYGRLADRRRPHRRAVPARRAQRRNAGARGLSLTLRPVGPGQVLRPGTGPHAVPALMGKWGALMVL